MASTRMASCTAHGVRLIIGNVLAELQMRALARYEQALRQLIG
jgi:hypothetical protein